MPVDRFCGACQVSAIIVCIFIDACLYIVYIKGMELEWDEEKRQRTLSERGLDFADVARLDWDRAVIIPDTRRDYGEPREVAMAELDGRLMVVAYTIRDGALRVISFRKANRRERKVFDDFTT